MNQLADDVRAVALALDPRDGTALATTWAFRALCRTGIVVRETHDSDIPCESWHYAMEAGFSVSTVVMRGASCGTIGCVRYPMVVIEHGPRDDRSRDLACWQCASDYARRPALRVRFLADALNGDGSRHGATPERYHEVMRDAAIATDGGGMPVGKLRAF